MTLAEFFPGNMGRMMFIRVMLRLRRPELAQMDQNEELDPALVKQIRTAIEEVKRG